VLADFFKINLCLVEWQQLPRNN